MQAQDRVKRILTDLEAVRENLLALSDDIWLNIDYKDAKALDEGHAFMRAYNEKISAFGHAATDISDLIEQFTQVHVDDGDRGGPKDSEENKHAIRELARQTPHSLDENYSFKRPYGFILRGQAFTNTTTWRGLYTEFCRHLTTIDVARVVALPDNPLFRGKRGNTSFARDPGGLLSSQRIADGIYAEGNMSANSIRDMMKRLLNEFGIAYDEIKVYLREDRDA